MEEGLTEVLRDLIEVDDGLILIVGRLEICWVVTGVDDVVRKLLDPRVQKLIRTYLEVFGELPPPASCDKLVQMDLKLKPEFVGHKIRRRPYPAPKEQADEIEQQIQ